MEAISPFVLRAIACDMEEMQSPQAWADRCRAAAAEIEKLRETLRIIADECEADYPPSHGAIKYAARAALGEKQ
jgi:hypothetical protein